MGLQANDDEILRPELGRVIGAAHVHDVLLIAHQQLQSVGAHGGKVRAPCNQADVRTRARELYTEIAPDCAGAVDADLHETVSKSGLQNVGTVRGLAWLRSQNPVGSA